MDKVKTLLRKIKSIGNIAVLVASRGLSRVLSSVSKRLHILTFWEESSGCGRTLVHFCSFIKKKKNAKTKNKKCNAVVSEKFDMHIIAEY